MTIEPRFNIFSLLILLGVFQGFFIGYFLLRRESRKLKRNSVLGLFVLTLSLTISEILLNYTGLITKVIFLDNFAEPLNFAIAPLFYLYIFYGLYPQKSVSVWPHFIILAFYTGYSLLYYLQPDDFKLNSYFSGYHPNLTTHWPASKFNPDPLRIREWIYELTLLHFSVYLFLATRAVWSEYRKANTPLFGSGKNQLHQYRNFLIHFLIIILIIIWVKTQFGRDIGDYFIASYVALLLYLTSFSIISRSSFFTAAPPESGPKYQKSSLAESRKEEILQQLERVMVNEKYYCNNLASLTDLAERIGETPHRVSQVINERCGLSFFNWMARYRVEEAKLILSGDEAMKYKIEELAEMVGYNSKASFNKAFKSLTGLTPSEFRDSAPSFSSGLQV